MNDAPARILGHAYWLPGAEGAALEAMLTEFVRATEPCRLVIEKQRNEAGRWSYSFQIDNL